MNAARLPLTMMDAALVTQTMPGRPMTTHHVLEHERPLPRGALERALEHLVRAHPVLRTTIAEGAFSFERSVDPFDAARARSRLTMADLPRTFESSGWVDRPFDLAREWPLRVRSGPAPHGGHTLCLSLHHSVTDGHGALTLFDTFLQTALATARGDCVPPPTSVVDRPAGPWRAIVRRGPRFVASLLARAAARVTHFAHDRAHLLDAPDAEPEGFGLRVERLSVEHWRALQRRARSLGCTRNDLLCGAALRSAAALRRQPGRAFRLLGGVDLRAFLAAPGIASNWIGTLETDVTTEEIDGDGLETLLHRRLAEARTPELALVTPVMLGLIDAALPPRLARALFRRSDRSAASFPYSLLVSHLRPPTALCWPAELEPTALWCSSTLPRKPGIGITITTVGEQVTLAACWPRPVVLDATIDALLQGMLAHLRGSDGAELRTGLLATAERDDRTGKTCCEAAGRARAQ